MGCPLIPVFNIWKRKSRIGPVPVFDPNGILASPYFYPYSNIVLSLSHL